MVLRGESASLISMGAIDFGIIVDASVIMVENICRHLAELGAWRDCFGAGPEGPPHQHPPRMQTLAVQMAAQEVSRPIFFSSAIIVAAFLPPVNLTGVEGQRFWPMALTH